jgi:signal transduction histidine kinase
MEPTKRNEALVIISHELRNELTVLTTWAALLRRRTLAVDHRRLAAATIERATEIARRLCDDLGAIVADTEPAFVPGRVDLRAIVVAGLRAIGPHARRKNLRVIQHVGSVPIWVTGDRVRLAEVMSNLLGNAIAFTNAGDTITVEVLQQQEDHVRLVVADTGAGISAAFLPHVFDKFAQEPRLRRRGRGLGLYVVRNVIERHNGSIQVESGGRARGARFIVTLPSAAVDAA